MDWKILAFVCVGLLSFFAGRWSGPFMETDGPDEGLRSHLGRKRRERIKRFFAAACRRLGLSR